MTRLAGKWRAFETDRRGATAVEFGLVALPLFMMILALAEMGLDFFCRTSLDVAAQKSARQISVGYVQANNMDVGGFQKLVCGYLPAFMPCSNLVFSVQTVPASSSFYSMTTSYDGPNGVKQYRIIQPSLVQSANPFCPGGKNQFVVLQYLYAMPVLTGIWLTSSVSFNGRTVRVIGANQVFRNESFTASNTGAGC